MPGKAGWTACSTEVLVIAGEAAAHHLAGKEQNFALEAQLIESLPALAKELSVGEWPRYRHIRDFESAFRHQAVGRVTRPAHLLGGRQQISS
jgi:hypothetical protein